jgi:prevent-host-death family protein
MTPHRDKHGTEVGVRELHNRLSHYVRQVAEGDDVIVTMRGRRVARLSPIDAEDDGLASLRARGLVQEPSAPRRRAPRRRLQTSAPVSDLVTEQRR